MTDTPTENVGPGGRIEPSPRNVGRPSGGVVPGIAARFGSTVVPLMP